MKPRPANSLLSRFGRFVSRLITRFAPPLHSIHWKVFVLFMIVLLLPLAGVGYKIRSGFGPGSSASCSEEIKHLAVPLLFSVLTAGGLAFLLSAYITRTVSSLADKAERIAAGEAGVELATWSKSELGALARSVEKMRRRLEGKAYVEEMAANLSHELKTPLASIRGAAELLEDGAIDDPRARAKFLGNIQTEVQRLDRLVADLLELSHIETHPEQFAAGPLDAVAAAREMAAVYRQRAENLGLQFVAELSEEPFELEISEQQFKQMLAGLLDNALQFTPSGRRVRLEISDGEIRVRDEGPGIDADILPKIFDRFFTTENPRTGSRGSGLGLAIVKSIVERNHGTIECKSAPGQGAEFIILF